jgi:hypothetical protein
MDRSLVRRAQSLISKLKEGHSDEYGFGSMTCTVYDTAWVAQVSKPDRTGHGRKWVFPECFQYVLDNQEPDGSWKSYASQVDGILNTAASLLALNSHLGLPLQTKTASAKDVTARFEKGKQALGKLLEEWDVMSTEHVAFEILVPAHLELLEKTAGLFFDFPQKKLLSKIQSEKLKNFRPELLYGESKLTALHSLEAFIGKIDFDQICQTPSGAMMASPSSTAAYLMNVSKWDERSEAYLAHVVKSSPHGAVPSAFPSTYFEYCWAISTLLKSGYSALDLKLAGLDQLIAVLNTALKEGKGTIGFGENSNRYILTTTLKLMVIGIAPSVSSDADDSSVAILLLNMLGKPTSPKALIESYEAENHFRTYFGERVPSFSANCNVLLALLHSPTPSEYVSSIEKTARFLYTYWYESNDPISDKWVSILSLLINVHD